MSPDTDESEVEVEIEIEIESEARPARGAALGTFLPDASTPKRPAGKQIGPAAPKGDRADTARARGDDQAWVASSSDATFFTRLGSTWMPGPIVVETVTFLM